MKINVFNEKFSSNLSCTIKCLGFLRIMNHKKIICGLFFLTSLGACGAPTAMIGPAYTLTTSGNVMQAGFAYSSSELVTMYTGKTPLENIKIFTFKSCFLNIFFFIYFFNIFHRSFFCIHVYHLF